MPLFEKKDLVRYVAEIFVVVLGILIAFQVDEWRDRLAEERELRASLSRLGQETGTNLQLCARDLPAHAGLASALHMVLGSLGAGRLDEADAGQFGEGLAKIEFNPQPLYLTTVAEEMIATGLLKNLHSAELRANIAELPGRLFTLRQGVANGSDRLRAAADELNRTVEYSYAGPTNLEAFREFAAFEKGITVDYEFEELANNRYLKNLLIEVTDIHTDRYRANRDLCDIFEQIGEHLTESNSR